MPNDEMNKIDKTARIAIHPKMDMEVTLETKALSIAGVIKNYSKERIRVKFDILFDSPAFDLENKFNVSVNLDPLEEKKYRSSQIVVPQFFKEAHKNAGTSFQLKQYNVSVTFLETIL